jgi:hypothetical protein
MKVDMNNYRNLNALETIVNENRENYRMIMQIWDINVPLIRGFETNTSTIF